jgi:hypothetical protein
MKNEDPERKRPSRKAHAAGKKVFTFHTAYEIIVEEFITVKDLAEQLKIPAPELIREFLMIGRFVTLNEHLDADSIETVGKFLRLNLHARSVEGGVSSDAIEKSPAEAHGNEGQLFVSPELRISFAPDLSADQVSGALTALADYFRACGGIGLRVEYEAIEIETREMATV